MQGQKLNTKRVEVEEDVVDIKRVAAILYRYKISIITITVLFALFFAYRAYFMPDIYSATATVEIGRDNRFGSGDGSDILSMATSPERTSTSTEMEIIKSRFLAEQAIQNIDFAHHYYVPAEFKELELYKASPFDVNLTKGYNISFTISPYNEESYGVEAHGVDRSSGETWEYAKVHHFGEKVDNAHFTFTLTLNNGKKLDNEKYRFVVQDELSAVKTAQAGVSVKRLGKFSSILAITCSNTVPLRAQEFTNALADAYISQSVYKKTREAAKTLTFVGTQLKKITGNLKNSAVNLENFKKDTGTVNLETKTQGVVQRLGAVEGKLAMMEIEVGLLNALYSRVKSGKNLETISVSGLSDESGSGALATCWQNCARLS